MSTLYLPLYHPKSEMGGGEYIVLTKHCVVVIYTFFTALVSLFGEITLAPISPVIFVNSAISGFDNLMGICVRLGI